MKAKSLLMASAIVLTASMLGACTTKQEKEPEVKEDIVKETPATVSEPQPKEVEEKMEDSMMPPVPTSQELTDVMKTYDSYSEYQGKLDEVGLTEPAHVVTDVALAGDGVNEYKADIYFYEASDGYFAIYVQGDKIIKELPESIGMNVWSKEDGEAFIADKK